MPKLNSGSVNDGASRLPHSPSLRVHYRPLSDRLDVAQFITSVLTKYVDGKLA
jgi:hypothetical protein